MSRRVSSVTLVIRGLLRSMKPWCSSSIRASRMVGCPTPSLRARPSSVIRSPGSSSPRIMAPRMRATASSFRVRRGIVSKSSWDLPAVCTLTIIVKRAKAVKGPKWILDLERNMKVAGNSLQVFHRAAIAIQQPRAESQVQPEVAAIAHTLERRKEFSPVDAAFADRNVLGIRRMIVCHVHVGKVAFQLCQGQYHVLPLRRKMARVEVGFQIRPIHMFDQA